MKWVYIIITFTLSFYIVIGAVTDVLINEKFELAYTLPEDSDKEKPLRNNEEYRNIVELEANEEYETFRHYYPMYEHLGITISYIINLIGFGVLGSLVRILLGNLKAKSMFDTKKIYTLPALGALLGLLIVVVSELLPEFDNKSGNDKTYYSMALILGIYSIEFFSWLEVKLMSLLNSEKKDS